MTPLVVIAKRHSVSACIGESIILAMRLLSLDFLSQIR